MNKQTINLSVVNKLIDSRMLVQGNLGEAKATC